MKITRRLSLFALCITLGSAPASHHQAINGTIKLPNGMLGKVYSDGTADIFSRDRHSVEKRLVTKIREKHDGIASLTGLPSPLELSAQLAKTPARPFAAHEVVVVFRPGVSGMQDVFSIDPVTRRVRSPHAMSAAPAYTNDPSVNRLLASLAVDRSERMFRSFNRSTLASLYAQTRSAGRAALDFSNAYRLHLIGASPRDAVLALRKLPAVAYASLDWNVSTMHTPSIPLDAKTIAEAAARAWHVRTVARADEPLRGSDVPTNYAISASAQSFLNSSDIDDVAAYDEITRHFGQLPGQGEIITNVSLGDVDDASAATNPNDRCNGDVGLYGPTTELIAGQHYLNWPSLPLIPTFVADTTATLSGSSEVCGVDPALEEVGLDFSVMAPLPDQVQRAGEQGSGFSDLLGIAPGASYRLVVPASQNATSSDIDAALLAAATQSPRPNVITASLGFGEDAYGFPGRYLEDDPLTEAIVSSIVESYHIVVCISANDGLRTLTNTAVAPSGGAAPTNVVTSANQTTDLNDIAFSTMPSLDFDSGAIDVGGTTNDDIFAVPPQWTTNGAAQAQHFYPETRWTGFTSFASGFGTRVDVAAPADNLVALNHTVGQGDDAVKAVVSGGTSGSAPEVAAAAAVALQVARLTGHPLSTPQAVRTLLASTGETVPPVPQADRSLAIGNQIDLRTLVEQLLTAAGKTDPPSIARIAVEERRFDGFDGDFESDTDPTDIIMNALPGSQYSWITLAPDWEFMPKGTHYRLFATTNRAHPLAITPTARLLPQTILQAAGLPFVSASNRTVHLTYEAEHGAKVLAYKTFSLTFAPTSASAYFGLALDVPPVVTGKSISISYDISNAALVAEPELMVSEPGRVDPLTGQVFHPTFTVPLSTNTGTVTVPVSSLQGAGVYGIAIRLFPAFNIDTDFAYTRVAPPGVSTARPAAPLLSSNGSVPAHHLEIPFNGSFTVDYDASTVSGATAAMLEVSAAGPGPYGIENPFNNPNGSTRDDNGGDAGSIYYAPLPGVRGHVTLSAHTVGLLPAMHHVIRVIPMQFGAPAGEAGEVSTIVMDGVKPADGGSPENGWSISQTGLDGFLTSSQQTAAGAPVGSIEQFDQTTNLVTTTIAPSQSGLYFINGSGIFGSDLGLIGYQPQPQSMEREVYWYGNGTSTFSLLDPASAGSLNGAWSPPLNANDYVGEIAPNQTTDTVALVLFNELVNSQNADYSVLSADLAHGTFGQRYDLMSALQGMTLASLFSVAENTTTGTALMGFGDFYNSCAAPTFETFALGSGTVQSFTGPGKGFPEGLAIDSTSGIAAYTTSCDAGLTLYNLASSSGNEITLPGTAVGDYVGVDPVNHRFFVSQAQDTAFFTDNNTLSNVLVYDENGDLLETVHQFNLFNIWLTTQNQIQVNPGRRSGYIIGPGNEQIVPFAY